MRIGTIILAAAATACLAVSCGKNVKEYPPASVADIRGDVRDFGLSDAPARDSILRLHSAELQAFMKTVSDDTLDNALLEAWASSAAATVFTPAADSVYSSVSLLEGALGHILGSAVDEGLDLPRRRYAAVVYGRPESILFVDSVMLIALNHYLGADYDGYSHWPAYMRQGKSPENMPYDIAEALVATEYPYKARAEENTVLANMLYQGALMFAKERLVPQGILAAALGYDDVRMEWLEEHEAELWRDIVASGLLYSTAERDIDRLMAPSPYIMAEDGRWPGRAGRYIGYRIVKAYLESHPGTSLAFMLSPDFYLQQRTLVEADYRP